MEKTIVKESTNDEKGTKWALRLFYAGWILVTIFYFANIFFMFYGTPNVVRIVGPKYSGIEYYVQQGYKGWEIFFVPVGIWLGLTFVVVMALEEKLREKTMHSMQRIWAGVTRRRASN